MYGITKTSYLIFHRFRIHRKIINCYFSSDTPEDERGISRASRILKDDLKRAILKDEDLLRNECDLAIVGGGIIGCAIAYWLQKRTYNKGFSVVVIDKDPEFTRLSTSSSLGGMRQQFSIPENIQMSLFCAEFLRNIKTYLSVLDMEPPDVQFNPQGYLYLAAEKDAGQLERNYNLQKSLGLSVELLTVKKLKDEFPWLNTDEIALGCLGLEKEGWFDPWALLNAFKRKAMSLGTKFINAEVIGFDSQEDSKIKYFQIEGVNHSYRHLQRLWIKSEDYEIEPIEFKTVVLAAGSMSGQLGLLADIGLGPGLLGHPIPVEPRKNYVFAYNSLKGPSINCPSVLDSNGIYFRRDGLSGNFIGGRSPLPNEELDSTNLEIDYSVFDKDVWPALAHRVPSFESLKLKNAWVGYHDYNTFDQNGIVGRHPFYPNLFLATGFNGHGIQHAPAIGRAITELIIDSRYKTIDLSRLGFERIIDNKPLDETRGY